MKAIVLLALLALACSQNTFLRNLQDAEVPPADAEAPPADTETPPADTETAPIDNEAQTNDTETPAAGNSFLSIAQFVPVGIWTLNNANCVQFDCWPQVTADTGDNETQLVLTLVYPTDDKCADKSGQTLNVTENHYNGMWADEDPNSPLYGWVGVYRLNNKTELLVYSNTTDGSACYAEYLGPESTNSSTEVPQNKTWEGAWNATEWLASTPGQEDQLCCVPDVPVIIYQDLEAQQIWYSYRTRDCDACGAVRNSVQFGNMTIIGGGGFDETHPEASAFLYMVNGTLVYNSPACAIAFEMLPATTCVTANTTDNEAPTGGEDAEGAAAGGQ